MIEPEELERGLERLGERISPRDDARARLERRFVRRRVARKAGTIALSLVVALVGVWAASGAFIGRQQGSGTSQDSTWVPQEVPTLWPENWTDLDAASKEAAAQQLADIGYPATTWRTDPIRVARRFTTLELDWGPGVHVTRPIPARGGSREVSVVVSCRHRCGAGRPTILLTQSQRPGPGGIWSVVAVADPHVVLWVDGTEAGVGDAVAATAGESRARVALSMGQGFAGRGGYVSTDGCTTIESSSPAFGPPGGRWETTVPPPGAATETPAAGGCGTMQSAYLFGYVKSGEGGGGTGTLFDPLNGILYHFSAIPLLVAAPHPSQPTPVAADRSLVGDIRWWVGAAAVLLLLIAWASVRLRRRSH